MTTPKGTIFAMLSPEILVSVLFLRETTPSSLLPTGGVCPARIRRFLNICGLQKS